MEAVVKTIITVETIINAPVAKVWDCWTKPEHIIQWNNASDDWHTPSAENDLRPGGRFVARMEARDGSMGFDFGGTYDAVRQKEYIEYTLDDDRKVTVTFTSIEDNTKLSATLVLSSIKVTVTFTSIEDNTKVAESFEAENMNSIELQRVGWQAILDNFKKHTEAIA